MKQSQSPFGFFILSDAELNCLKTHIAEMSQSPFGFFILSDKYRQGYIAGSGTESQSPFGFFILSDYPARIGNIINLTASHNRLSASSSFRTETPQGVREINLSHNRLSASSSFRTIGLNLCNALNLECHNRLSASSSFRTD